MKFITLTLIFTIFCFTLAHQTCKNTEYCHRGEVCSSKNICVQKSIAFCQNDLACQLKFGKNTRCVLEKNENFGKCQKIYVPGGECKSNGDCSRNEYCTGDKKTNKIGKCTKKPEKFCQNISHCKVGEICEKMTHNLGICKAFEFNPYSKRILTHIIKDKFIPPLTPEAYAAAPMGIGEKSTHRCGMEDLDRDISKDAFSCSKSFQCDSAATRDSYSSATGEKVYKIRWLFFRCGSGWESQAQTRIAEATQDLNTYYKDIGYQFNSYYNEYTCQGSGSTNNDNFDTNKALQAIQHEIGFNFQQSGFLHIVVGRPDDDNINGWFFFPGSSSASGTGFMNTRVVAKGYSTLAHEIGHGFGLYHTFTGISELNGCSDPCRETSASNDLGDYCSDTPPVVRNWDCQSPLTGIADPCNSGKTTWDPNPYENIMSYGNCRYQFTPQQKSRVRCFQDRYLQFLVEDTAPVQQPGLSTLPTAPGNPMPSIPMCAGIPWLFPFPCPFGAATTATYSIFGIVILLFFTLFA